MTVLTAGVPVTAGVFDALQDADFQYAIGGRLHDDLPEDVLRPCCLIEILNETDKRGFGTGDMPECDLRLHTFSDLGTMSEARDIDRQIKALLKDATITVAGYTLCGTVVYHNTVTLPNQELNGVKVHEIVSLYTVTVEQ